jgi:hypothetical protein
LGQLKEKINEDDVLSKELEDKYLKILEKLLSNKALGKEESEALIGVRKEFLRRNLTLVDAMKELQW